MSADQVENDMFGQVSLLFMLEINLKQNVPAHMHQRY